MTVRTAATKFVAIILGTALVTGCGDSLSSLDGVQSSVREVYDMYLQPDYGLRGKTVVVTVAEVDEKLELMLADNEFYPVEISFGEGTHWKTFNSSESDLFQIEVAISPLARKGKREPYLVFSVGHQQKLVEVRGSFWITPSLDE